MGQFNTVTPDSLLKVGQLVALTTGSTMNNITYAYPLYRDYKCTQLIARSANAYVKLKQTELGTGTNMELPIGTAIGDKIDYSFTGHDIVGWIVDDVYAVCYSCSDCSPLTGSTRSEATGSYVQTIGGAVRPNYQKSHTVTNPPTT